LNLAELKQLLLLLPLLLVVSRNTTFQIVNLKFWTTFRSSQSKGIDFKKLEGEFIRPRYALPPTSAVVNTVLLVRVLLHVPCQCLPPLFFLAPNLTDDGVNVWTAPWPGFAVASFCCFNSRTVTTRTKLSANFIPSIAIAAAPAS
jgi:hypothetical protein